MTRQPIQLPSTNENWDNLPIEFLEFLDQVDSVREMMDKATPSDPLYPSYDYVWDVDSTIALDTLTYYWNKVDEPLPEINRIVEEISQAMGEAAYDSYVESAYSY